MNGLLCLINYKDAPLFDALRRRWSFSPLKYYKMIDVDNKDQDVENVQTITIKYVEPLDQRLEKWFSCEDMKFIKQELITLRR